MAHTVRFFMSAEDELAFLRFLACFELEVYLVRISQDWGPFVANEAAQPLLPDGAAYLAASALGDVLVDKGSGGWTRSARRSSSSSVPGPTRTTSG
jgi:hypothetical protein